MKANVQLLKKQRVFSPDFKRQVVKEFESGRYSVLQLSKLYDLHPPNIYQWIYKFSNINTKGVRIVEMKTSSTQKLKELSQKVKDLEGIVGRKQIEIDYLNKVIDLANADFKTDLKKSSNTQPSNGSKTTKAK